MRAIVLAAGQGTRLRPLTDELPKCLVELCGESLLDRQARTLRARGIEDILVVGGYRADAVEARGYNVVRNPRYEQTNMVASLFCASAWLDGAEDVLITYGDIVYEPRVLGAVMDCDDPLGLAVDLQWRRYWSLRFEDPLADAETLRLDTDGHVVEVGKKPTGYDEIQAQYMGLIRIRADRAADVRDTYARMDRDAIYDGKEFDNMYMTSFLQHLIDSGRRVRAIPVHSGWLEIDSMSDLELYHSMQRRGELAPFFNVQE